MTDTSTTRPPRACIVCIARNRGGERTPNIYERPYACAGCREWLAGVPGQIVALWQRLGADDQIRDLREYEVMELFIGPLPAAVPEDDRPALHTGEWRPHDPVAAGLPTTARGTRPYSDRVSGSAAETPVPVNINEVDLTSRIRRSPLSPIGQAEWRHQIGHRSVAMELDLIVRAWADRLTATNGHLTRLPVPTVPRLAQWLTDRMDWACDHHAGIGDDANTLTRLRSILRGVLGDIDPKPEKMGAPCPGCDYMTLFRRPGEDNIECTHEDCLRVLTPTEYNRWHKMVHADVCERTAAADDGGQSLVSVWGSLNGHLMP